MRNIDQYLDLAAMRNNHMSDRQLSKALGKSHGAITHFRTRRSWPDDATMVKLCELADIDPAEGLLDLNMWRNTPEVRAQYSRMAELIKRSAAAAVITFGLFSGSLEPAKAANGATVAETVRQCILWDYAMVL